MVVGRCLAANVLEQWPTNMHDSTMCEETIYNMGRTRAVLLVEKIALICTILSLGTFVFAQPVTPEPTESGAEEPSQPDTETSSGVTSEETANSPDEAALASEAPEESGDVSDDQLDEEAESATHRKFHTRVYGYIEAYWEKVANTPEGVASDGTTVFGANPYEFDVRNINVMIQTRSHDRFRGFLNVAAPGGNDVSVRNAWVEVALLGDALALRAGKMYRPFGLYNEILDAIPTYIGIEPPELLDGDHLMLTRTTNLMLRGRWLKDTHSITYSLTTGNDERKGNSFPLGADLRYRHHSTSGNLTLTIGGSAYSSLGDAVPSRAVGEGSPDGGVATWMESDEFYVFGGYLELTLGNLHLQGAYWRSHHDAKRNPQEVIKLLNANLNPRQLQRFGIGGSNPTVDDVIRDVQYTVQTAYGRLGYTLNTEWGAIVPYMQYDFYRNPETIQSKDFGGDNEAGLSDNGQFHKATTGLVYRPISAFAAKIDGSIHIQDFNGTLEVYPEIRMSLSYHWQL